MAEALALEAAAAAEDFLFLPSPLAALVASAFWGVVFGRGTNRDGMARRDETRRGSDRKHLKKKNVARWGRDQRALADGLVSDRGNGNTTLIIPRCMSYLFCLLVPSGLVEENQLEEGPLRLVVAVVQRGEYHRPETTRGITKGKGGEEVVQYDW